MKRKSYSYTHFVLQIDVQIASKRIIIENSEDNKWLFARSIYFRSRMVNRTSPNNEEIFHPTNCTSLLLTSISSFFRPFFCTLMEETWKYVHVHENKTTEEYWMRCFFPPFFILFEWFWLEKIEFFHIYRRQYFRGRGKKGSLGIGLHTFKFFVCVTDLLPYSSEIIPWVVQPFSLSQKSSGSWLPNQRKSK